MQNRLTFKWKAVSIVAAAIIPGAAEHHMQAGTIMPQNSKKFSNNVEKVYNLSEARTVSAFPIREPETISNWKREASKGLLVKHVENSKASGVDTVMQSGNLDAKYEST